MKNISILTFLTAGFLSFSLVQAMEIEETKKEDNTTPIAVPVTFTVEPLSSKIHHEKEETNKLQASINNLMEQPKEQRDEIEKMLVHHKKSLQDLTKKYDDLKEHVIKLHDSVAHLKKPAHYSRDFPSAGGATIIAFYAASYAGKAAYNILKHGEVKKNICKLLLAGGIVVWSGAQAKHYWQAFYTPTLSEKEEEKVKQLEKQVESGTILNDQTKR